MVICSFKLQPTVLLLGLALILPLSSTLVPEEQEFLREFISTLSAVPDTWSINNVSNACDGWFGIFCTTDQQHIEKIILGDGPEIGGTLVPSIGNLSYLIQLVLADTQITGAIPKEICQLHNLVIFNLKNNLFNETIPDCINATNFPYLNTIILSKNKLRGDVPAGLFSLPNLINLHVSKNLLTGTLPATINATNLQSLEMTENALQGTIPSSLASLPSIKDIKLHRNHFSCPIKPFLDALEARSSPVTTCDISHNLYNTSYPTLCGDVTTPVTTVCKVLPALAHDLSYHGKPSFSFIEKQILVETYDSRWLFFAMNSAGEPFRNEYLSLDFNSFVYQITHRSKGGARAGMPLEQHLFSPFTDYKKTDAHTHTFYSTLSNGAQIELSLDFGLKAGAKFSLKLTNWTLPDPEEPVDTYAALFIQAGFVNPHSTPENPVQCIYDNLEAAYCAGIYGNATISWNFEQAPGLLFSSITKNVEASYVFGLLYYLDDNKQVDEIVDISRPPSYLLPYGEIAIVEELRNIHETDIPQGECLMFPARFKPWNHTLLWDPDVNIRLLFDTSNPPEQAEQDVVAIAAGVVTAILLVAAAAIMIAYYFFKKKNREKHSRALHKALSRDTGFFKSAADTSKQQQQQQQQEQTKRWKRAKQSGKLTNTKESN